MSERFIPHDHLTSLEFLKKFSLGFDIDGVIADSRIPGIEKFNELCNTNYKPEDALYYNQTITWAKEIGKTDEEAYQLNRFIWDSPEVLYKALPTDGSLELMSWLYGRGIRPFIITSRISQLRDSTLAWADKYFPFVDNNSIKIGQHTDIKDGENYKIQAIKDLGISLFIEDVPHTAERILNETKSGVILVEHQFNYDFKLTNKKLFWSRRLNGIPTLKPILDCFIEGDH